MLNLIGERKQLFIVILKRIIQKLKRIVPTSNFPVIGGGELIEQAVTKEIFKRKPKKFYVIDIQDILLVSL